jgi:hypothetical protein
VLNNLNGYVTNPNPTLSTLTLTPIPKLNPNCNPNRINKKSKKKRLQKIDRAVCWMENSANHFIFADEYYMNYNHVRTADHFIPGDSEY